jgi:CDGSH-type Zn-finger protein/uncharacterized Fe-S cluster protein YjdI
MSDKKVFDYVGKTADVHWDGRLCIHVGECGQADNSLFVGGRKPWCVPDEVAGAEVADVVARCPTGALTLTCKDGSIPVETVAEVNRVVLANNGPLYLSGDLQIDGAADDMPGTAFRAALCRCGKSANKPFCDNSHEKDGFVDRGACGQSGDGLEAEGGKLVVKRIPNGPLLVNGGFSIVTASGRTAFQGTKAALCRCGASKNRPFCDGSHKAAGFTAD